MTKWIEIKLIFIFKNIVICNKVTHMNNCQTKGCSPENIQMLFDPVEQRCLTSSGIDSINLTKGTESFTIVQDQV